MKSTSIFFILLFLQVQLFGQIEDDSFEKSADHKLIGISLHSGVYDLKADVPGAGVGFGLRFHVPVNFVVSMRLNYFASTATGISDKPWVHSSVNIGSNGNEVGGALVDAEYRPYENNPDGWFPSYSFSQKTSEIEGLINLAKLFKIDLIDLYIIGGYGIFNHTTELDLLDKSGSPYPNLISKTGWTVDKYDTKAGRKEILKNIESIYDGNYETRLKNGNTDKSHYLVSFGFGMRFNLNSNIGLGLEWKEIKYDYDQADGLRFLNSTEFTQNQDNARYINLFAEMKF
jgi:hypothetical protein